MRQFTAALAAGVLLLGTPSLLAQDKTVVPVAAKASPELFTDADKDASAIEKGLAALVKTRQAYRSAPAITENIMIEVKTPMGDQKTGVTSAFGDGTFQVSVEGQIELTGVGTSIYMVMLADASRYMESSFESGSPEAAIIEMTQGGGIPDPAIPFRLGKAEVEAAEIPTMLGLGAMPKPTLQGYRTSDTGSQVLLSGDGNTAVVSLNGKSGLVDRIDLKVSPPGAPPEFSLDVAFVIDAKVLKALPKPITFDVTGRKRVDTPDQLGPQPLAVGDKAPEFTLDTLGGESISLADLKGQVVVVDFWATWCGPCKRGLPVLNEVAKWAKEEGLPVRFFGCNVWEQGDKNARLATAKGYWDGQNFAFESLLDADDSVVAKYGVTGIPTSFVIGPDGTILEVHQGFDPAMAESMKEELRKAASNKG
jgi:thiol-disulfide isomerase/thioredoxin